MEVNRKCFNWHFDIQPHLPNNECFDQALKAQTRELQNYSNEVAQSLLEALDFRFNQLEDRFDELLDKKARS